MGWVQSASYTAGCLFPLRLFCFVKHKACFSFQCLYQLLTLSLVSCHSCDMCQQRKGKGKLPICRGCWLGGGRSGPGPREAPALHPGQAVRPRQLRSPPDPAEGCSGAQLHCKAPGGAGRVAPLRTPGPLSQWNSGDLYFFQTFTLKC